MTIRIATADDFKRLAAPFPVELQSGLTVLVRRPDITTLVMLGTLSAGVLSALQRYEQRTVTGSLTGAQLVEEFESEERDCILEGWRIYACDAIVEPRFTFDPDIYPSHVPITDLGLMDLLAIYNARPPIGVVTEVTTEPEPPAAVVDLSKVSLEDLEHLRRIVGEPTSVEHAGR